MKKIVEDLEDAKFDESTHSYWAALSILAKNEDGSYRLFIDDRGLNKQIEKTSWPLPSIIDSLGQKLLLFSKIDMP